MAEPGYASPTNTAPEYQGRPIAVSWQSTPALWMAYFAHEYDGAPDAGFQPVGYGKTEEAAVADLIEMEEEHG